MEAMQAEAVADGQQPMTSDDIVSKVIYLYQGKPPPSQARKTFFLKNANILRSSTRAETHFGSSLLVNRKVPLPSVN
jgi:hypothetical protein